jgi:hypothetical protein
MKSKSLLFLLTLVLILDVSQQTKAANHNLFNDSEKVIYFLDVSRSSDSKRLWTFLKSSLLERIETALGSPEVKGIKPTKPTDLSISVINDNSQAAQVIEILSIRDAEKIWGFMINTVGGGNPSSVRMKAIYKDFFGSTGAYTLLVSELPQDGQFSSFSISACPKRAEEEFKKGNFMRNVTPSLRQQASKEVCMVISKLINGINQADSIFKSDQCADQACSDVIGAVQRAQAVAVDLAQGRPSRKPKICLAIASDMLNNYPGVSRTSPWNTLQAIKNSQSTEDAEKLGRTVAEEAGIKFTSKVKVRVEVIGQGASRNFPRELRSKLDAYWNGFWSSAGVQGSAQQASLDQACK